ncbi:hypothetical protein llap_2196 [Limosa lapponica baueri]|uniref:Uncharacterized protein n=1 Tax=Limosa lapponica baueri TaxID=1758121 RepID=A0A2I0UND3_LIMLA|nr:hypothetical protein llap_2196 [Limosa lapponica baueri]
MTFGGPFRPGPIYESMNPLFIKIQEASDLLNSTGTKSSPKRNLDAKKVESTNFPLELFRIKSQGQTEWKKPEDDKEDWSFLASFTVPDSVPSNSKERFLGKEHCNCDSSSGKTVPLGLSRKFSSKSLSSRPGINPLANHNTGYHFIAKKRLLLLITGSVPLPLTEPWRESQTHGEKHSSKAVPPESIGVPALPGSLWRAQQSLADGETLAHVGPELQDLHWWQMALESCSCRQSSHSDFGVSWYLASTTSPRGVEMTSGMPQDPHSHAHIFTMEKYKTAQDPIGPLGDKGTLLSHGKFAIHQNSQILLLSSAFQKIYPKPILVPGVLPPQVQDPTFALVEPH